VNDPTARNKSETNRQLDERQKIATHFRQTPKSLKLKAHKMVDADCEEIISDLITFAQSKVFLSAFGQISCSLGLCVAYAVFYRRQIAIVVDERKSYVLFTPPTYEEGDDQAGTLVLQLALKRQEFFRHNSDLAYWADVKEKYYCCMTYKKALPAISNFKLAELEDLANKLGVASKGGKKADIYLAIQLFIQGL
jgi:hypothetical protein